LFDRFHIRFWWIALAGAALLSCGGQVEDSPRAPVRGDASPILATLASGSGTGSAQLRAGDFQTARATYEALLAANPDQVGALNDLAVSYYLAGRFDSARQLFDEVVIRGSAHEQQAALLNLGELYAIDGYLTAAKAHFDSARSIDPSRPAPIYAQALFSDLRGQPGIAVSLIREAIKADEAGAARAAFTFAYPEERQHLEALVTDAQGDRESAIQKWRDLRTSRFPALAQAAQRHLDDIQ
jgi:tetratricopeptide (TPR) repeat protein